jgi:hypothetical protein
VTPEQKARLEAARVALYECLCIELEAPLPGLAKKPERDARYWQKKNATATANLIFRVEDLLGLRGAGAWARRAPRERDAEDDQPTASAQESAGASSDPAQLIAEAEAKVARALAKKPDDPGSVH